ncbi:MAG: Clp protease N-terminal domain-containing protein [Chloroflexota bacterium]
MESVTSISLRDIEGIARVESAKMQHFYVGVEHLFIALTKLEGGLTADIFEQIGQSGRYLRYATRELAGRGDDRRYWPGYRNTPRATTVLNRAQILINSEVRPDERALLLAILDEGASIPVRVLRESGVAIDTLREMVRDWSGKVRTQTPVPPINGGESLSDDERLVLQQMFQRYDEIKIEHIFHGGYSGTTVVLVRPVHADGRSDAPVVVKMADRQSILWEKKRYDSYVKDTLPPTTARMESEPTLPEKSPLGGIKYTFVRLRGEDLPVNLREYAENHDSESVALFLREALYNGFREAWWGQAQPYRFAAWQEYEFLLPPALIVQIDPGDTQSVVGRVLRPLEDWSRTSALHPGDMVELENFTVQKAKRTSGTLQVAAGAAPESINRSSQIEIRGMDLREKSYFRGELIRKISGRVLYTRDDLLQEQVQALDPNFNILDDHLPYTNLTGEKLPNPLRRYAYILDLRISGTLSTIHGDLYMDNVLIGPGGDAWLIDFEWTRDGHTLYDWAMLEMSLLIDHVRLSIGQSWEEIWSAIKLLDHLNRTNALPELDRSPLAHAFSPIVEIRGIVSELLATDNHWIEYQVALALCALRVIGWSNRPLVARRLSFLASALAMDAARMRNRTGSRGDITEVTTDLN